MFLLEISYVNSIYLRIDYSEMLLFEAVRHAIHLNKSLTLYRSLEDIL